MLYGTLVGNYHFEDRRGFDDCENCSLGDSVRIFGLNFIVLAWDSICRYALCVHSDEPLPFVSLHKKSRWWRAQELPAASYEQLFHTYRWICIMLKPTAALSLISSWILHCDEDTRNGVSQYTHQFIFGIVLSYGYIQLLSETTYSYMTVKTTCLHGCVTAYYDLE